MLNVLLVDDEKLERVLIRKGYNWEENGFNIVGEAASGEDALEYINYHNVDIVITDINMPGMDGLQFTEKLLQKNPKCRVVIVTGFREFEYARKAIKLGVDEFLLKPVNIKEISEVMTKIKWFQLRLFRTIRHQICSIDMIDIETFTNIFRLLNHVDRSIIEKYIQGYSIKSIADEFEYSKAFVSERIYVFRNELKKEISKKQSKVKN